MEYWNEMQTEKSWKILKEIAGKFPFILIGGWAVYLWTKSQKSRDIDVIIDIKTLPTLKRLYELGKNEKLQKYEIKIDEIDIDIYVTHYSRLAVRIEDAESQKIEGFEVAKPEFLLALKQGAEWNRKESEKGEKDRIDIIGMLLKCDIDFAEYKKLLQSNGMEHLLGRLLSVLRTFNEPEYFGMNPRQFKLAKNEIHEKIRHA